MQKDYLLIIKELRRIKDTPSSYYGKKKMVYERLAEELAASIVKSHKRILNNESGRSAEFLAKAKKPKKIKPVNKVAGVWKIKKIKFNENRSN